MGSFKEAVEELFVKSDRIKFDLGLDLKFPDQFTMQLVCRPWRSIPLANEWRGFVRDFKLTALSQYFTHLHFPALNAAAKATVARQAKSFHTKVVAPLLRKTGLKHCVVDLIIDPGGDDTVLLLEINDWLPGSTGAALFDWDSDREVLWGESPFELRVNEKPVVDAVLGELPTAWRELLAVKKKES